MSYTTAKANFEATVKSMQADLDRYIKSGKANQRAVDIKTEQINKLVEFYDAVETEKSAQDERMTGLTMAYNKLHTDTQRLVYFCAMHRINPNHVFYYTETEIKQLAQSGRKFGAADDFYFQPGDQKFNEQTDKYLTTKLICSRK